jgi:predicted DNA-binding protein YlxM (UPF0122 family)
MRKTKDQVEKIIKAFKENISAKDIANMFDMKREAVYSFVRAHVPREEYISLTIARRSKYDGGITIKRNSILTDMHAGIQIADIAGKWNISEYAVRYYYYKYMEPSERKKYLKRIDARTDQTMLKKVSKIKELIATLGRTRSVETLANIEGKKYNTMWVYLNRNKNIIEGLTGMKYSDFLTSVRGYSHVVDLESVLEGIVKEGEAHRKG